MDPKERKGERKAVGLLVKLKHQHVAAFEEEFATNLSEGGMFIRSRQPQPVDTLLKFEVQLAGGQRVMRGRAVVRWTRAAGVDGGPSGMGVEFEALDEPTRALVDRLLKSGASRAPATSAASVAPSARLPAPIKTPAVATPASPRIASAPAPPVASTTMPAAAARPVAGTAGPATAKKATAPIAAVAPLTPVPPVAATTRLTPIASLTPQRSTPTRARASELPDELAALEAELAERYGAPPAAPIEDAHELDLTEAAAELDAPPAPPDDAIDLSIDDLVADTPPPAPVAMDEGSDEIPVVDFESAGPDEGGVDFEFGADTAGEADDADELDIDLEEAPEAIPTPAPPAARAPPSIAAAAAALPQVRRQATPTVEAPTTPQVLTVASRAERKTPVHHGPVFLKAPEGEISATGPVIGIDLGTTNSCVALLQNGKPLILRSKDGYNTVPSVLSLTSNGKLMLAHRAKSQMVLNPSQTIYGAKRLVGRAFDSAVVREVKERFHYEVVPDSSGRAAVLLGENVLSLEEVQGLILRECREMAEQQLNTKVSRAVITVPAYYSEPQREAVRRAGTMAGLKVERILNEPTAAALAFGLNKNLDRRILVYDLGGGTFDATILKIEKNVFEVLATGGDVFLGGIDFDNQIVDMMLGKFSESQGIRFTGDAVALSRVAEAAEKAKCALSERSTFDVDIPMLMMDEAGKPRDLRCTVTRDDLERATGALVERTLDVVRDVLLDAKLKAGEVDEIILVGGMSRMPIVREKLKEMFGKPPHANVNADEAVALGAALYSGTVDKVSSVVLIDVLPMTIGLGLPGGAFKRVVERNTPLPAQKSFALTTSKDNETTLELSVFQGEEANVAGNEYLGTVRIEGLPKMPKGVVKIAVTIRLDAECVLQVEANELTTRKAVKATLATRYTSDEVQKKLGITREAADKAERVRADELKSRGGGFWGFLKKVVGKA